MYNYVLSLKAKNPQEKLDDDEKKEMQNYVNATLGLMTAGCEVCSHSKGLFCDKLGRQVNLGDPRCEYFERRPSAKLVR